MVRVTIERCLQPNKYLEMGRLLMELRAKAMRQRGYVSGESLRSLDDPSQWLVISTWLDSESWKAWERSSERQEITGKMKFLLIAPERVSVYSLAE